MLEPQARLGMVNRELTGLNEARVGELQLAGLGQDIGTSSKAKSRGNEVKVARLRREPAGHGEVGEALTCRDLISSVSPELAIIKASDQGRRRKNKKKRKKKKN